MLKDRRELWLPIRDFPDYEISTEGRVRHVRHDRMVAVTNSTDYPMVVLFKNKKRYIKKIHRLVAQTFYDINYLDGLEVNHIDGDKYNAHISNLEWVTKSENVKHAYDRGLKKPSGPHPIRRVRIIETGEVFDSASDCARYIGGDFSTVCKCLRANTMRTMHKGFHFEYVEEK